MHRLVSSGLLFFLVSITLVLFQIPGVSVPAPDVEPQAKKAKLDR